MIKNATHKKPLKTKKKTHAPLKKNKKQRTATNKTNNNNNKKKNCVTCMLRNFPSESVRWVLTGAFPPLSL